MARLGSFDVAAFPLTSFDVAAIYCGSFDVDYIPCQPAPPPPPPPPPPPRPRPPRPPRPVIPAGGGVVFPSIPYCPPDWLPQYLLPYDECEELCPDDFTLIITSPQPPPEEVADFALMHVTSAEGGAIVKALAAGIVETTIDAKGRTSIVLTSDDGTRYLYADVGATTVADGARVRTGQTIARTKSGAPSIPEITTTGRRPELSAAGATPQKPKPAQVVFVDPAPEPRYWVRLEPIEMPPPPPQVDAPRPWHASPIIRAVAPVALVAAILLAVSLFEPKPPKSPKSRSPKKRKKRKRKQRR